MSNSTITPIRGAKQPNRPVPNRKKAEGHEIPLASFIKNRTPADIEMMIGEDHKGVIVRGFDKWTITIDLQGEPYTIFKHAIIGFKAHQEDDYE